MLPLTRTEFPDTPGNGIPGGKAPNIENSNPFFLTNSDQGRYNFLFDPDQGQPAVGSQSILVVTPPAGSDYLERRIQIEILGSTGGINSSIVSYRATALDGQPISIGGGTQISDTVVEVPDAEVGDILIITDQTGTELYNAPVTLLDIANGVEVTPATPAEGDDVVVTATLTDPAGNVSHAGGAAATHSAQPGLAIAE